MLIELKMRGTLTAKHVCVLAYWAKGAGVVSPGSDLAMHPKCTGGRFSAHFDHVTGMDEGIKGDWFSVPVPSYSQCDLSRRCSFLKG